MLGVMLEDLSGIQLIAGNRYKFKGKLYEVRLSFSEVLGSSINSCSGCYFAFEDSDDCWFLPCIDYDKGVQKRFIWIEVK